MIRFSSETLAQGLQVDANHNLLVVLQDRVDLLRHLGQVLQNRQDYFGTEVARPGNLMGKTCFFSSFLFVKRDTNKKKLKNI